MHNIAKSEWRGNHFFWPIRIYYEDTDLTGYVFHAYYLKYAERARTEMMRALNLEYSGVVKKFGVHFVVKKIMIDYLRPAFIDDMLYVETYISYIKSCSIAFKQIIWRKEEKIATFDLLLPCLNKEGKIKAIPSDIRYILTSPLNFIQENPFNAH